MARWQRQDERALYIISVAAELAGVHPQTLRIYERKGLIEPPRTRAGSRRYSDRDIALLQPDPGAHQRRREPRRGEADHRPRGGAGSRQAAHRASSSRPSTEPHEELVEAVNEAHRQYRRDLGSGEPLRWPCDMPGLTFGLISADHFSARRLPARRAQLGGQPDEELLREVGSSRTSVRNMRIPSTAIVTSVAATTSATRGSPSSSTSSPT